MIFIRRIMFVMENGKYYDALLRSINLINQGV
jgi:hypothetical protein